MAEELSIEQLSDWTAESPETLRDWKSRGLIAIGPEEFSLSDIEAATVIRFLLRRGLPIDDIERAEKIRPWIAIHIARRSGSHEMPGRLADVAQELDMDRALVQRIWEAVGLSDQGDLVYNADRAVLFGVKRAMAVGFPEDAMLSLLRVYHDTIGRAVEASTRTIHAFVHERVQTEGATAAQAFDQVEGAGAVTAPMLEPTILYFVRKAGKRSSREDVAIHIAQDAGLQAIPEVLGSLHAAIAFVDLSASTPLAAQKGDADAAAILLRFSSLIRASITAWGGQVVKQIGDEFMLVFPDAARAVSCLLAVHARAQEEAAFPAVRTGINAGDVLYREGDYVGSVVNIAARLIGIAEPGQVLVSSAVRREAGSQDGAEFKRLGRRQLKGLPEEVEVFEACAAADPSATTRVADPVCGLQMSPTNVGAKLTLDAVERSFCSDECLRTFVMNPAKYQTVKSDA